MYVAIDLDQGHSCLAYCLVLDLCRGHGSENEITAKADEGAALTKNFNGYIINSGGVFNHHPLCHNPTPSETLGLWHTLFYPSEAKLD